ncbi:6-hydroxymethylpterin diphosphokinase MptE-like protein [Thermodesulfobacteriota bacterium]
MSFNIIQKLRNATPKKRRKILRRMRQKNQDFFARTKGCQDFAELLKNRDVVDYEIKITDKFLDIIETKTGLYCHPPGDLLGQVERLANPYHKDWQTVINPLHGNFGETKHGKLVQKFIKRLYEECPEVMTRRLKGDLTLPVDGKGKMHSGPVVFLGVFHGLHIFSFLEKVSPSHVILIEPDIESFLLSCYFVDYEYIGRRFATLSLDVGGAVSDNVLNNFFDTVPVSSRVWVRFLPVYHDQRFSQVIEQVKLRWAQFEVHVPFEDDLSGLVSGVSNIKKQYRYCPNVPLALPCESIAVVGSGPSLKNDLEWLRANHNNLLLITATSTGLLLQDNDVSPDVQTFIEVHRNHDHNLKFLLRCPTVIYYKSYVEYVDQLENPILYAEGGRCNSVRFLRPLWNAAPTSANLAFVLACLFQPKNIYLVGMDFCTREVEGGIHAFQSLAKTESYTDFGHDKRMAMSVEKTNFPESQGKLESNSYFWAAKESVENNIRLLGNKTTVWNLSDGVLIEGAEPVRSKQISLAEVGKPSEVEVLNAFPVISSADWSVYPDKGVGRLAKMKKEIVALFGDRFGWDEFLKIIDLELAFVVNRHCDVAAKDMRMDVFSRLIFDVVTEWYRAIIYAENTDEAELLYANGKEALMAVFQDLEWPLELDAV